MDNEIRQLLLLLKQPRSTPIEVVIQKTHVRLMVFHEGGFDFRFADFDSDLVAMFNQGLVLSLVLLELLLTVH
jgi:hypothetical protein